MSLFLKIIMVKYHVQLKNGKERRLTKPPTRSFLELAWSVLNRKNTMSNQQVVQTKLQRLFLFLILFVVFLCLLFFSMLTNILFTSSFFSYWLIILCWSVFFSYSFFFGCFFVVFSALFLCMFVFVVILVVCCYFRIFSQVFLDVCCFVWLTVFSFRFVCCFVGLHCHQALGGRRHERRLYESVTLAAERRRYAVFFRKKTLGVAKKKGDLMQIWKNTWWFFEFRDHFNDLWSKLHGKETFGVIQQKHWGFVQRHLRLELVFC